MPRFSINSDEKVKKLQMKKDNLYLHIFRDSNYVLRCFFLGEEVQKEEQIRDWENKIITVNLKNDFIDTIFKFKITYYDRIDNLSDEENIEIIEYPMIDTSNTSPGIWSYINDLSLNGIEVIQEGSLNYKIVPLKPVVPEHSIIGENNIIEFLKKNYDIPLLRKENHLVFIVESCELSIDLNTNILTFSSSSVFEVKVLLNAEGKIEEYIKTEYIKFEGPGVTIEGALDRILRGKKTTGIKNILKLLGLTIEIDLNNIISNLFFVPEIVPYSNININKEENYFYLLEEDDWFNKLSKLMESKETFLLMSNGDKITIENYKENLDNIKTVLNKELLKLKESGKITNEVITHKGNKKRVLQTVELIDEICIDNDSKDNFDIILKYRYYNVDNGLAENYSGKENKKTGCREEPEGYNYIIESQCFSFKEIIGIVLNPEYSPSIYDFY